MKPEKPVRTVEITIESLAELTGEVARLRSQVTELQTRGTELVNQYRKAAWENLEYEANDGNERA
jgi:hypothetical protein